MRYIPKTKPFQHQRRTVCDTWKLPGYGLFWEVGCGKSKAVIDTAGMLYETGQINGLQVVAPNGVHANWCDTEIPGHLPDRIPRKTLVWDSSELTGSKKRRNALMQAFEELLAFDGLAVIAFGYGAFATVAAFDAAEKFLVQRRSLMTVDESARIKNYKAQRTARIIDLGKLAKFRRALSGTPITQDSFDIYTQVAFLQPSYWTRNGFSSRTAFENYFGEWKLIEVPNIKTKNGKPVYRRQLISQKNLDELAELVAGISSRVRKEDALDLPPKMYRALRYPMSPDQRRIYTGLRDEYMAWVSENNPTDMVTADLAIQRLLRMRQAVLGYTVVDGETEPEPIPGPNPRLELLRELLEDASGQVIVWAPFRRAVDQIMDFLGNRAVRFDGGTNLEGRRRAVAEFRGGAKQFFVATPAAAGEGWTLVEARSAIFYANDYRLDLRLQAEGRNHRIGQNNPVDYTDLIAIGSLDAAILRALRMKREVSQLVLRDPRGGWLDGNEDGIVATLEQLAVAG